MPATLRHPFNVTKDDANPRGYTKITREIWEYYCQMQKRCLTCKLKYEDPIPECLSKCRFQLHPQHNKRRIEGEDVYYCVETKKGPHSGKNRYEYSLSIRRYLLNLNYELGLDWIFVTGNISGTCVHHIDHDYFNDLRKNGRIIPIPDNSRYPKEVQQTLASIKNIETLLKATSCQRQQLFQQLAYHKSILQTLDMKYYGDDSRYKQMMIDVPIAISNNQIYTCPTNWRRKYTPPKPGSVVRVSRPKSI